MLSVVDHRQANMANKMQVRELQAPINVRIIQGDV
ncbi:MAG: hypothetical protein ACI81Y_000798 [Glaciecola sp.]